MGYNPANFAYHIGTAPWVPGYTVYYAVSFYDARTDRESPRSEWWGPKTDLKQLYGGFGLIRVPGRFDGPSDVAPDLAPVTTKYQDDVL
jgi:hypothetical protein